MKISEETGSSTSSIIQLEDFWRDKLIDKWEQIINNDGEYITD